MFIGVVSIFLIDWVLVGWVRGILFKFLDFFKLSIIFFYCIYRVFLIWEVGGRVVLRFL